MSAPAIRLKRYLIRGAYDLLLEQARDSQAAGVYYLITHSSQPSM